MPKPPLNVIVVWHPGFEEGEALAHLLYATLSHQPRNVLSPSLGIPVYIRTSILAGGKAPVPRAIDLDDAEHTVVLVLIDTSLSLDKPWLVYGGEIADRVLELESARPSPRRHLVLPIRLKAPSDSNLGRTQAIDLVDVVPPERKPVMLQLRVMAEICRLLNHMPRGGAGDLQISPERMQLFLSHAKRDGETDAQDLLAKILTTPLEAFFDKEHIASGYDFSDEIRAQIRRSALVVIQSDAYASRPWCRREVLEAKKYERPIVVVHRMSRGEDRSFPYLGNVPTMGWTGDNHYEIIAATVREYLRKIYTKQRFEYLETFDPPQIPKGARSLFRPPELVDGALFRRRSTTGPKEALKAEKAEDAAAEAGVAQDDGPTQLVVYPDPPIGTEEVEILADFFPEITFVTPTTIARGKRTLKQRTVGLSIAASPGPGELGFVQSHHMISAMTDVARHVLAIEGAIAYGGDLRPSSVGGLTDELFTLVRAYKNSGMLAKALVIDYLAWPAQLGLANDPKLEIELNKVADLKKLDPRPGLIKKFGFDPSQPIPDDREEAAYVKAVCLSDMRRTMNEEVDARVVMGGKIGGFSGRYPGLLEEVHLAIKARKPVYLLGAFGGSTGLVIRAIRGEPVPEFSRDYQVANSEPKYGRLLDLYDRYRDDPDVGDGPVDYDRMVGDLRDAGVAGLNNGLSPSENDELFASSDSDRVNYLLVKGLTTALGSE